MAVNMLKLSLPKFYMGKSYCENQIENNQKIKNDFVDATIEKVGLQISQFPSTLNNEFSSLDLRKEVDRLKTYRDWRIEFLKKEDLAIIVFYYVGRTDKVKCFSCKITIDKWEPNDNPLNEHLKWSPTCPLLRRRSTANIAVDEVLPYIENNQKNKKDCVDAPMEKVGLLNPQVSSPLNIEFSSLDLRKEVDRLKTYRDWRIEFLKKEDLAIIGFYYVGRTDKVKCFFCKITIDKWEPNDNPLNEHLKWSPTCPLLRRRSTANIAVDEGRLNRLLPAAYFDTCGSSSSNSNNVFQKYPEFQYLPSRLKTFEAWPPALSQKPTDLAEAGFFYTGNGDKVICFSCGTGLKDWDKNDIPIEEHARHTKSCSFLNFIKDENYCQDIKNKYLSNSNSIQPAPLSASIQPVVEIDAENENDSKDCKICYANPAELVFIPCGHVYCCRSCGFSMTKCPVCRENINEKHRIFF